MPFRASAARLPAAIGLGLASVLALAGCVQNDAGAAPRVTVAIADRSCTVSRTTGSAGTLAFVLTNTGTDVNEFEVLASDQKRIVAEKENIAPGQTVTLVTQLDAGRYYTGCKFRQTGSIVERTEFTVIGAATTLEGSPAATTAVRDYVEYVRSQVQQLTPAVARLVSAYRSGDDADARALFGGARVFYERIEPIAEKLGDLDPRIDYREVDAVAEGLDWTGFHRIEKDLWPPTAGALNSDGTSATLAWTPSTASERATIGGRLVTDVQQLGSLVDKPGFTVTLADITNGAIGLLDEVAASKITGEEDWWSHSDLSDFQANVQGAEAAFEGVKAIAASRGAAGTDLVARISVQFRALNALLARYGSLESGFVPYDQVTDAQRKELSDQVNALAEPLSRLTHTVLGVSGS